MKKLLLMVGMVCLTLSMSLPAAKAQGMGKGQGPGESRPRQGLVLPVGLWSLTRSRLDLSLGRHRRHQTSRIHSAGKAVD